MLMGFGPFRFTVPTFSVEEMDRKVGGRVAHSPVIGTHQPTHLLGPQESTITLRSTFHPLHLNRAGEPMLAGLEQAAERQTPYPLISFLTIYTSRPHGVWVLTDASSARSLFAATGHAQTITTDLQFTRYVGRGGFRGGLF